MDGFSNRAGGALQSEPDSHRRSAGVVLPTSLLDALLRSVPAASVPPLLTATLLTPFLTADYATSLLRERCILEGAPDYEHTDALRGHCASEAGGLSVRLRDHGQSIPAARPLTDDDLDGVLDDLDIGLRMLAPQRRRDFFRGYLPVVDNRLAALREDTVLDVAAEYLSMSRTQWVARFPCDVSFSLCVLHFPPYRCIDGTTRHGQLEVRTSHHTAMGQTERRTESSRTEIGCRCWFVSDGPGRKRPRDAHDGVSWRPDSRPSAEVFHRVTFGLYPECWRSNSTRGARVIELIRPFIALTPLGRGFDATLLIATAFCLSQLKTPNTSDAFVPLLGTSHTPLQTLIGLLDHDSCYEYECDDDGWDLSSEEEEEEE